MIITCFAKVVRLLKHQLRNAWYIHNEKQHLKAENPPTPPAKKKIFGFQLRYSPKHKLYPVMYLLTVSSK